MIDKVFSSLFYYVFALVRGKLVAVIFALVRNAKSVK